MRFVSFELVQSISCVFLILRYEMGEKLEIDNGVLLKVKYKFKRIYESLVKANFDPCVFDLETGCFC